VCRLSSRRPLVTSLCQLVVASPLVVLSLCRPLVVLSLELVVTLPLAVLSLRHPLVLSCASLLLHRFSSSSCCVAHSSSPHADRLFCHLFMRRPLLVSWSRGLVVSWSCRLVISSSRRAALSPYPHASWLAHHLSSSSRCAALLSSHRAGWLLRCLSLHPPLVLSSCRPSFNPPSPRHSPSPTPSNTVKCCRCH
jgi:hypothetical protein